MIKYKTFNRIQPTLHKKIFFSYTKDNFYIHPYHPKNHF